MITLHTSIISLSNLIWYRYNINTYSMYCRFKHIKYWVPQRLNPSINCELFCWGENSYQIRQTPRKQNKVKMFFFFTWDASCSLYSYSATWPLYLQENFWPRFVHAHISHWQVNTYARKCKVYVWFNVSKAMNFNYINLLLLIMICFCLFNTYKLFSITL